jgi:hypothetical protein
MDKDYYTFEGTAGQWVSISTTANPDDDNTFVDTVITLFDAAMNQIAQNDDRVPRANTDSEIIIRLPDTGTYYIEVQEFSEWMPDPMNPPEGDPTYTYELDLIEIVDEAAAVTIDTEAGDDVASALPVTLSMDFGFVLGTFDTADDIDVYTVTVTGTADRNLTAFVMPGGVNGYGSNADARIWITDEPGTTIIARIDQTDDYSEIAPNVAPGMYRIFVEHGGTAMGENDFYVLKVVQAADSREEMMDVTNGVALTPEPVMMMARPDASGESGFFVAHLSSDTDVDYFSFDVPMGRTISIACGSASSGSGVMGLEVRLTDAMDMMITSRTEAPPMDLLIENAMPRGGMGTHLVRLSKTGQDPEVTGDWVRCGVHLNMPMTP